MVRVLLWEPWGGSASCLPLNPPFPTLYLSSWPQLPPFAPSPHPLVRRKALVLGPSPTTPQDLQLPLVVAMQERVWGSPHCKVTTACVHQDVELSEKGERKDIADRQFWTHRPVVLLCVHGIKAVSLTALEPRPQTASETTCMALCVMLVFPVT